MVALADSAGLRLLQFADSPKLRSQKEHCLRRLGPPIATRSNEHLEKIERELAEYFARERSRFSVPIAPFGTPWQLAVWSRLLQHRADSTLFYEELARELGSPKAVRAVGSAVGANPLLIVCPCHRVIPKKGGVGGYAAAPWRKERLLSLEASTRENGPAAEERPPTHGTMTSNSAGEIEKEQGV
ncbi:Methylated-DNA--protein-cysteine methyltransferase, inducible [Methylacidimicrobium cyclopophantes]|uniref:Methylated-DNA--protein-cysteine methyltransferase, inducible n=2 Tax=Methylacidimicrobium cyclopophantes TaxID=1041766 RepID=A0A5E6M8J2_9BACT|nr:Methylated-DNA--protein-cysteine methyltransferase, inducible [Methylacidimicrobium cyclopophantes]